MSPLIAHVSIGSSEGWVISEARPLALTVTGEDPADEDLTGETQGGTSANCGAQSLPAAQRSAVSDKRLPVAVPTEQQVHRDDLWLR